MASQSASPRAEARFVRSEDERDDTYGPDSFPASDPPSTWWGGAEDIYPTTKTSPPQ